MGNSAQTTESGLCLFKGRHCYGVGHYLYVRIHQFLLVKRLSFICQYIDKQIKHCYYIVADRTMLYTYATELTFKRHLMSSGIGPPQGGFFLPGDDYEPICIY